MPISPPLPCPIGGPVASSPLPSPPLPYSPLELPLRTLPALLALLACAPHAPAPLPPRVLPDSTDTLKGEVIYDGSPAARTLSGDGAALVLLYGGEEKGSLSPCGCPDRPRGGLPRAASIIGAVRAANPGVPTLLLNGGAWLEDDMGLDGEPRLDVAVINRWMVSGVQQMGYDAINLAYPDLFALHDQGSPTDLPLVSANIEGPGATPSRTFTLGALRVAVTAISNPSSDFIPTPGYTRHDPVRAAGPLLTALDANHDLVILLAWGDQAAAKALALQGHVDVVIDTDQHNDHVAPFRVGKAVWVHSHRETRRLGELRLGLDAAGVAWAHERKIDLDPTVPDEPGLGRLAYLAAEEIERVQRQVFPH